MDFLLVGEIKDQHFIGIIIYFRVVTTSIDAGFWVTLVPSRLTQLCLLEKSSVITTGGKLLERSSGWFEPGCAKRLRTPRDVVRDLGTPVIADIIIGTPARTYSATLNSFDFPSHCFII